MTLKELNQKRWDNCHIPAAMGPMFQKVSERLSAPDAKARYQAVEKATGVPWQFIAVVHEREASQRWDRQLAQGDPLSRKSTHVPKGRGPFSSWEEGAIDALVNCAPYAARNKDWSIGGTLAKLEEYNGLGYYRKGIPSPYIWSGTDQYVKGKYVADGVFDANHVDKQLGCAGLLKFMGYGKTGPTGAGTAGAVIATVGAGAATAAASPSWWSWTTDHWLPILVCAIGAGIIIDMAIAIYNNEKNNKNVG